MNANENKKRLIYIDVLRILCAFVIVWHHYECLDKIKYTAFNNIDLSSITNLIFFIISGISLELKYKSEQHIDEKAFFIFRAKALYPCYWYNYFLFLGAKSAYSLITNGDTIFSPSCRYFFLTIIGMDGYLYYKVKNFYLIGEWFFGAIIIIYLLFPLIHKLVHEHSNLFFLLIFVYQVLFLETYCYEKVYQQNAFSYILAFSFGVFLVRYEKSRSVVWKWTETGVLIGLIMMVIVFSKYIPSMYCSYIIGISLVIIVRNLFNLSHIDNNEQLKKFFSKAGKYTLTCFLVHHKVEYILYEFIDKKYGYWLNFAIMLTAVAAVTLFSYHSFAYLKKIIKKVGKL